MYTSFQSHLQNELQAIEQAGLYKNERIIVSPQGAVIRVADGQEVLNFCANNYLGLSNSPELKQAAKDAIDSHGYGVSSVRFICGTQDVHKQLESAIAQFFGTEDTILYAACFDANGGVFEPLLTIEDIFVTNNKAQVPSEPVPLRALQKYPLMLLEPENTSRQQLERLLSRDAETVEQAEAIIAAQVDRQRRLEAADDVIRNDGSADDLAFQDAVAGFDDRARRAADALVQRHDETTGQRRDGNRCAG